MTVTKIGQKHLTQVIDMLRWTLRGDEAEAAAETRRRARLCGPDSIAFLRYVQRTDKFSSPTQRVRATNMLLDVGEYLSSEKKETGLLDEEEEAGGADERDAG
jgi:hypothetical protein